MSIFSYIKHYPLATLEIIIIWILCMIPIPETPLDDINLIDKWTHFVMYGSLTLVIWCEYMMHHGFFGKADIIPVNWKRLLIGGVILPILMGGMVELAQAYLTTCRSGEWLDLLCDSLGVFLGVGMGYSLLAVRLRR